MIPAAFDYHRATSLDDAVRRLGELGDEAKILAGGHSLIPFMRLRLAAPTALVDLHGLAELRGVRRDGATLRIGALTRHRDLETDPVVRAALPLLATVAGHIGDPQVRNRGTIAGAVAHADPAGEYAAVCLMLDARIVTTKRELGAAGFFLGRYTTPLDPDEIITEIAFPVEPGPHAYLEFCQRLYDWALVGVAVQRTASGWRVGLVNVSDTPVRAAGVERALAAGATAAEAAERAPDGLDPIPTSRAPTAYRVHLTRVLTRRALAQAGVG